MRYMYIFSCIRFYKKHNISIGKSYAWKRTNLLKLMKRTCISESFFFGQTGLSLSLPFSFFSLVRFSFTNLSLPTTCRLAINNTGSSGVVLIRSRAQAQIRQNFLFYIVWQCKRRLLRNREKRISFTHC